MYVCQRRAQACFLCCLHAAGQQLTRRIAYRGLGLGKSIACMCWDGSCPYMQVADHQRLAVLGGSGPSAGTGLSVVLDSAASGVFKPTTKLLGMW